MVIAVRYRVNSIKVTHFRIWATSTLREFIVKGLYLNDQMLKNGRAFGKNYFDKLLEKIRQIRDSERRVHQKVIDLILRLSLRIRVIVDPIDLLCPNDQIARPYQYIG